MRWGVFNCPQKFPTEEIINVEVLDWYVYYIPLKAAVSHFTSG